MPVSIRRPGGVDFPEGARVEVVLADAQKKNGAKKIYPEGMRGTVFSPAEGEPTMDLNGLVSVLYDKPWPTFRPKFDWQGHATGQFEQGPAKREHDVPIGILTRVTDEKTAEARTA